eukprot:CAMPEP_0174823692 /NCGR_PEP_ID=MMETSP1107-20130205/26796_1 /TAXON_ID=36770 /ORGANISM="Paraphysomonas vestita, Strain GFlagA" /LENGTH=129 /DNA_ID=CAMNT_0016047277 /DNA_START=2700 /DNA_END=3089 /DNA_ORIENTATION=+
MSPLFANNGIIKQDRFAEATSTDSFEFFYRDGSSVFVSFHDPKRIGDYPQDETTTPTTVASEENRPYTNGHTTRESGGDNSSYSSEVIRTKSDIERGDLPVHLKSLKEQRTSNPMVSLEEDENYEDDDN